MTSFSLKYELPLIRGHFYFPGLSITRGRLAVLPRLVMIFSPAAITLLDLKPAVDHGKPKGCPQQERFSRTQKRAGDDPGSD